MIWYVLSFMIWFAFVVLMTWYMEGRLPYVPHTVWRKESPYFNPDPFLTE